MLGGYGNGVSTRKVDHVEQLRIDLMTEDRMSVLCRWAEELTGAICARTFARGSDGTVHFTRDTVMYRRRDQRNIVAAAPREVFNAGA